MITVVNFSKAFFVYFLFTFSDFCLLFLNLLFTISQMILLFCALKHEKTHFPCLLFAYNLLYFLYLFVLHLLENVSFFSDVANSTLLLTILHFVHNWPTFVYFSVYILLFFKVSYFFIATVFFVFFRTFKEVLRTNMLKKLKIIDCPLSKRTKKYPGFSHYFIKSRSLVEQKMGSGSKKCVSPEWWSHSSKK